MCKEWGWAEGTGSREEKVAFVREATGCDLAIAEQYLHRFHGNDMAAAIRINEDMRLLERMSLRLPDQRGFDQRRTK